MPSPRPNPRDRSTPAEDRANGDHEPAQAGQQDRGLDGLAVERMGVRPPHRRQPAYGGRAARSWPGGSGGCG